MQAGEHRAPALFGLHCGVWGVDWQSRQAYNVCVRAPCEG